MIILVNSLFFICVVTQEYVNLISFDVFRLVNFLRDLGERNISIHHKLRKQLYIFQFQSIKKSKFFISVKIQFNRVTKKFCYG